MLATQLTARDVMSPDPISVRDDRTASEVVELLREHDISGAPVLDATGQLAGVISLADLAGAASAAFSLDRAHPGFFLRHWEDSFNPEDLENLHLEGEGPPVRELMTPASFVVAEETPVGEVARIMREAHIHRVLVTRGAEAVGIISALDLLALLASGSESESLG